MALYLFIWGWDHYGNFYVASELKALEGVCNKIQEFLPGHYLYSRDGVMKKWYNRDWMDYNAVENNTTSIDDLKSALEASVHRQLMSDVPYGVLLSGGLDSSIVSAIAKKFAPKRIESEIRLKHGGRSCIHLQLDLKGHPIWLPHERLLIISEQYIMK